MTHETTALPTGGLAVVVGSSGAIGGALARHLRGDARFADVLELSRGTVPPLDLLDEASIAAAAQDAAGRGLDVRLVVDATGFLHGDGAMPEKTWRHLDPAALAHAFAVNAIGPALLMKHFLPLLPRDGRSLFATLSARAGSMAENTIGGWYGYRASKAALNQLVRTAAAELGRTRKQAVCVALHPGHVESRLSAPFGAGGNPTLTPDEAAARLLAVLDGLTAAESGGFFDHEGQAVPW
jgi:NAD(P)-dependent dehydrogenase (short-subunit alcohol dehydrogenase family)